MTNNNGLAVGIVYTEQAKLDWLAIQLAEAQYQVDQCQAIVDALTAKSQTYNDLLTTADANRATALTNLNLAIDVDSSVGSLCSSTGLALTQTTTANSKIQQVSKEMATLISKLILSVELIERFGQLVNKQKASNPLIPDSLIRFMAKAATDANNAVALTLTALQSCYVAEATLLRSKDVIALENHQVTVLKDTIEKITLYAAPPGLSGLVRDGQFMVGLTPDGTGVLELLHQAFDYASEKYNRARKNVALVNKQLAQAQSDLATVTTSVNSYTAGLAAATAAVYSA
jgi:hypothetical protein